MFLKGPLKLNYCWLTVATFLSLYELLLRGPLKLGWVEMTGFAFELEPVPTLDYKFNIGFGVFYEVCLKDGFSTEF